MNRVIRQVRRWRCGLLSQYISDRIHLVANWVDYGFFYFQSVKKSCDRVVVASESLMG